MVCWHAEASIIAFACQTGKDKDVWTCLIPTWILTSYGFQTEPGRSGNRTNTLLRSTKESLRACVKYWFWTQKHDITIVRSKK